MKENCSKSSQNNLSRNLYGLKNSRGKDNPQLRDRRCRHALYRGQEKNVCPLLPPCPGEDQQKQCTQIVSEEVKGLVMIAVHLDFLRA